MYLWLNEIHDHSNGSARINKVLCCQPLWQAKYEMSLIIVCKTTFEIHWTLFKSGIMIIQIKLFKRSKYINKTKNIHLNVTILAQKLLFQKETPALRFFCVTDHSPKLYSTKLSLFSGNHQFHNVWCLFNHCDGQSFTKCPFCNRINDKHSFQNFSFNDANKTIWMITWHEWFNRM